MRFFVYSPPHIAGQYFVDSIMLWSNIIQPRLISLACTSKPICKQRSKVIPFAKGEVINGETVAGSLDKISEKIDIVDIFRPSKETPDFAKEAVKIGAKVLWLQYGIENEEAKKIAEDANIQYVSNLCIKQEYQKLFQKANPVFPVLKN